MIMKMRIFQMSGYFNNVKIAFEAERIIFIKNNLID